MHEALSSFTSRALSHLTNKLAEIMAKNIRFSWKSKKKTHSNTRFKRYELVASAAAAAVESRGPVIVSSVVYL